MTACWQWLDSRSSATATGATKRESRVRSTPLYWIGIYVLNAYLFKRNWAFLVGTVLVLLAGSSFFFWTSSAVPILRFILIPYVLMAFRSSSASRRGPRWPFTVLLFIQVIITPEYLFALPAFLAVLIVHDVCNRKWSASRSDSFVRTQRALVAGVSRPLLFSRCSSRPTMRWMTSIRTSAAFSHRTCCRVVYRSSSRRGPSGSACIYRLSSSQWLRSTSSRDCSTGVRSPLRTGPWRHTPCSSPCITSSSSRADTGGTSIKWSQS